MCLSCAPLRWRCRGDGGGPWEAGGVHWAAGVVSPWRLLPPGSHAAVAGEHSPENHIAHRLHAPQHSQHCLWTVTRSNCVHIYKLQLLQPQNLISAWKHPIIVHITPCPHKYWLCAVSPYYDLFACFSQSGARLLTFPCVFYISVVIYCLLLWL